MEEYAGDERVVIINQASGGLSAARNVGLDYIVYYYRKNDKGIFFQSKTNIKVIDSFWILKKLIEDMEIFGIKNLEYYHVVLERIKTCASLSVELGNISVDRSLFYACCQLIANNFQEYVGEGKYLFEMKTALVSRNYMLFRISYI